MVCVRVARERQLFGIAQCANVSARRDRIVCPLPSHLLRVANGNVRYRLVRLVAPFHTGRWVDLGVCIRPDERIEECVDRQRCGRVAQRGEEVGVEVRGQV